jgi:CelD/BcsL family acetyltransferase involved in cellulose biosynthesis
MQLETVHSLAGLEEIKQEWSSFGASVEGLTPFQVPDWLLAWWRHFGSGSLNVSIFRENGALVGVIPCFLHKWRGLRQLTLIGSGISDYLEPAISPRKRAAVVDALRVRLIENREWEVCDWQDLAADTPLTGLGRLTNDVPCSRIKLTGHFDEYWAQRSKDLRRNLRRYSQRAQQTGAFEFAVTCRADRELMDELIRLHGDRWHKRREAGLFAANDWADFLLDIARRFERLEMLRLFTLRFRGEIAAVSIGFLYRSTLYSYLSAFAPGQEILGFGRKLLYESLRHAYQQGWAGWNFCRGDEPYKFSFGAEVIPKCRLILTRARAHTA